MNSNPMIHKKYLKLLCGFVFLLAAQVYAQQTNLEGIVVDANSELPLIGATVLSGVNGTITNQNGEFVIQNQKLPFILQFNYIGYKTQEIVVRSFDLLKVRLVKNSNELEEVIISSGYMQQNKKVFRVQWLTLRKTVG